MLLLCGIPKLRGSVVSSFECVHPEHEQLVLRLCPQLGCGSAAWNLDTCQWPRRYGEHQPHQFRDVALFGTFCGVIVVCVSRYSWFRCAALRLAMKGAAVTTLCLAAATKTAAVVEVVDPPRIGGFVAVHHDQQITSATSAAHP